MDHDDDVPTVSPPPRAPAGLATSGRRLWRSIVSEWDLDPRELPLLAEACRTSDLIDRLEHMLNADGLTQVGSTGQPRLSQVVSEIRQQRLTLDRLLNSLSLPTETGRISRRQSLAAQRRWEG